MPELPEVETVRRGVTPHIKGRHITDVQIRQWQLRWAIPADLPQRLAGTKIEDVKRRGKYLLIAVSGGALDRTAGTFDNAVGTFDAAVGTFDKAVGTLMIHLGMSGRLFLVEANAPPAKHDHVDFALDSGQWLRFSDPRRFGAVLFEPENVYEHPLLAHLGPEPLESGFDGDLLYQRSRGRTTSIKSFVMDSRIVVGVGNIYANEALFLAGIRPTAKAGKISRPRYRVFADAIKQVLAAAIEQGGTTLRDFVGGDGKPGYFSQRLNVYGRAGLVCPKCGGVLKEIRQNNRSSVFCPHCQR